MEYIIASKPHHYPLLGWLLVVRVAAVGRPVVVLKNPAYNNGKATKRNYNERKRNPWVYHLGWNTYSGHDTFWHLSPPPAATYTRRKAFCRRTYPPPVGFFPFWLPLRIPSLTHRISPSVARQALATQEPTPTLPFFRQQTSGGVVSPTSMAVLGLDTLFPHSRCDPLLSESRYNDKPTRPGCHDVDNGGRSPLWFFLRRRRLNRRFQTCLFVVTRLVGVFLSLTDSRATP